MANLVITCVAPALASVSIMEYAPTNLVAPAQVWLKATDHSGLADFEETGSVYEGAFHEYYHEWTINGEPLDPWVNPENLIAEHNNPNKAFGREVAFCFSEAGSYTVDLVVTDKDGNTATASSSEFVVAAADDYYSDAQTIYIDPDGVYADVPVGVPSANKVSTMAAGRARVAALNNEQTRVLFRRGKEYDFTGFENDGSWWVGSLSKLSYMGAYGTGADPVFLPDRTAGRSANSMFELRPTSGVSDFITFVNLNCQGDWDPTVERGAMQGPGISLNAQTSTCFAMTYQCKVTGCEMGIGLGSKNGARILVADCNIQNWRDYGIFGGETTSINGIVGTLIKNDPEAHLGITYSLTGSMGRNKDILNGHGPCRLSKGQYIYISGCDFFNSNQGWDGFAQAALRLLVAPEVGQSAYVERCVFEGGFRVINVEDSVGATDHPFNVVIERCLLLPTMAHTSGKVISPWRSGLTIRDCVMHIPNVAPKNGPAGGVAAITLVNDGTQGTGNLSDPIIIHSNTYVNLLSAANDNGQDWNFFTDSDDDFSGDRLDNNVIHKPSMDTSPDTTFAPIDTSTALSGVTPRYTLFPHGFQSINLTLSGDVADSGTLEIDYAIIHQKLQDGTTLGGATDQSYWSAIEATDTRHETMLYNATLDSYQRFLSEDGHFTVSFDASVVTITNTSGVTWPSGRSLYINLDRTSLVPASESTWASPSTVPLPRPTTGSAAIGAATTGRVSPKDFLLTPRGATPSKGALEPA